VPILDPTDKPESAVTKPPKLKPAKQDQPRRLPKATTFAKDRPHITAASATAQLAAPMKPRVENQPTDTGIHAALSNRASQLPHGFVNRYPGKAAEAILSPTPTIDLAKNSSIVEQGLTWAEGRTMLGDVPGGLLPYYRQAFLLNDAENRNIYLQTIDETRQMSPDDQASMMPILRGMSITLSQGGDIEPPDTRSLLQQFAQTAGQAISLPFVAAIAGADVFANRVLGVKGAGAAIEKVGTGANWALRNTVGAAAITAVEGVTGQQLLSPGEHFQSWNDMTAGEHSPQTVFFAKMIGQDPNDPNLQGLFEFTDLEADLSNAVLSGHLGGEFMTAVRKTPAGGGVRMGDAWVDTRWGNKQSVNITEVLKSVPEGESAVPYLIDQFPNMRPQMAAELARTAPDLAEVKGTVARYIDRVPERELPRIQTELNEVRAKIADGGKSPGTVDLKGQKFNRYGESVGDIQSSEVRWVRTEDLKNLDNQLPRTESVEPGKTLEDYAKQLKDTGHYPKPLEIFLDENGRTNLVDGNHTYAAAKIAGQEYVPVRTVAAPEGVDPYTARQMGDVTSPVSVVDALPDKFRGLTEEGLVDLKVREATLEQWRSDLQQHEVAWEFPRRSSIAKWMRSAGIDDGNIFGRALRRQFGEAGRTDISKWSDDMSPRENAIYDRTSGNIPPEAVSDSIESMRKTMNIAKVPKDLQRTVVDEYMSYTGRQGFERFNVNFRNALEEGLKRGGKRVLSPEMERTLLRFSDRTWEERLKSPLEVEHILADGSKVTTTENVLQKANNDPLPSRPSQFLGNRVSLPNPELLRQASSFTRYWGNKLPGYVRAPLEVTRFVSLTVPRLVLRPLMLVGRAGMAIKIQLDEMMRNVLSDMKPLSWKRQGIDYTDGGIPVRPGVRDLLKGEKLESYVDLPIGEDVSVMGLIDSEMMRTGEFITSRKSTRGFEAMTDSDRYLIGRGVTDRIVDMHLDELTQSVATRGAEGTLQYIRDHPDSRLTREYEQNIRPLLEENGITPETWLDRTSMEIDQATGGNATLREAVGTGSWDVGRKVPTGEAIELGRRRAELEMARTEALSLTDDAHQYAANLRVEDLQRTVERLERSTQATRSVSLKNNDELVNQVLTAQAERRFTMPKEVTVRQLAVKDEVPMTGLQKAQAKFEKVNQFIYKGLRPLSSADVVLSRGSTYRQVLDITRKRLETLGYSPAEALRLGQYHAAYIAKDLHYDISARSTVDRQLKDVFWFLPVVRENLFTYLVKMPREHFWPVGIVAEVGGAHALVDGLKDMGLLRYHTFYNADTGKDDQELVLHVPWVSDFVGGLQGDPTAGDMRVGGLNPAVAGQGVPTISPGVEKILDMTAKSAPKSIQPIIEFIARTIEYDADPTLDSAISIPSPLRYGLERLGIHVPWDSIAPGDIANAKRKAAVQSLQWAAGDLAKDGILPPGPGSSDDEVAAYQRQLEGRAGHYRNTTNVLHIIGAVLLPGSVTTGSIGSTPAANAYRKWRDADPAWLAFQDSQDPSKYVSEEDQSAAWDAFAASQRDYLREHPAAWAIAIGTKQVPDGFEYTPESYADLPTLEPEAYVEKMLGRAMWEQDKPEKDPDSPEAWDNLSPRQKTRRTAAISTEPLTSLSDVELHALKVPDFEGRKKLLKDLGVIADQFEAVDLGNKSEDERAALYKQRDALMRQAAQKYGQPGLRLLSLTQWDTTPADRLKQAGYLRGQAAASVMAQAADIWRDTVAKGYNPMYDSSYVIDRKRALFEYIDRVRAANPEFDQEMRRLVMGISDKSGALSNVDGYNRLFFNSGYGTAAIGQGSTLKTKTKHAPQDLLGGF
jgi:hypothetical protein